MKAFDHDLCLSFFGQCHDAKMFEFPPHARVLEIGCAEADWSAPMKSLRPDLHVTSIDVRKCKRPKSDVLIEGDVLTHDFPAQSFDCIVSVSTIEHIGLGAYGDPTMSEGDILTMARCHKWLKPGGWMYFDVPYGPSYSVQKNFRRYDEEAVAVRLLVGWTEVARMVVEANHPDAPYLALTLTHA